MHHNFDLYSNLGEYPRCWREVKRQGPELVEGIPSLEPKEFSVTLMNYNMEVSIDKVNKMGNFQECIEE